MRDTDIRRLRRDGGRDQHGQRGAAAGHAGGSVAHHDGITGRVRGRNIGQRERCGRGTGNIAAVFLPLVSQWRRAAGDDCERHITARENGGADRLRENCRRHQHGQRRGGTRERADDVGDHDGITGRVIRSDDGKRKDV